MSGRHSLQSEQCCFPRPLLRAINLSIAVLLIALLRRRRTGTRGARCPNLERRPHRAHLRANATISRDALGVPHIHAATIEDALFLQGFVTAQDRMWQMDALRRLAAGELAEVVGKSALDSDR